VSQGNQNIKGGHEMAGSKKNLNIAIFDGTGSVV
jgi:hypothetical protein